MSFSLSFNLKTLLPDILTVLQNVLVANESNIIPTGVNLTKQGFQLLAFQSSCKYIVCYDKLLGLIVNPDKSNRCS